MNPWLVWPVYIAMEALGIYLIVGTFHVWAKEARQGNVGFDFKKSVITGNGLGALLATGAALMVAPIFLSFVFSGV